MASEAWTTPLEPKHWRPFFSAPGESLGEAVSLDPSPVIDCLCGSSVSFLGLSFPQHTRDLG